MMFLRLILVLCVLAIVRAREVSSPFWPQPSSFFLGSTTVKVCDKFEFKQIGKQSHLLQRGIERYHEIYANYRQGSNIENKENEIKSCSMSVNTVHNSAADEKASLDLDVDETYNIKINESGECEIVSSTVWGALHAMETFTQLLSRKGENDSVISMNYAPVTVQNSARFAHRGVLLDSSRHFLPIKTLKTMIDSLTMANFNVMHWHVEDAVAFPLDTPSSPEMYKGAYKPNQVYSMKDVQEIDQYATDRGIRIVYEVDGPGHAASWGKGYPDIMTQGGCQEKYSYDVNLIALNPVLDKTYKILSGIMKDIIATTGTKYMHLGGDEVEYGCWEMDDVITDYMKENDIATYPDLLGMYVLKAEDIARKMDTTPIQWEDTFIAGVRPPTDAIFDVWTNSSQISAVTGAGYRVIAAPQDYWYLDHADNTWEVMYSFDPEDGLNEEQKKLIVGGEASMWGELVDQYNIQTKVWPTAAAVAERLWTAKNATHAVATYDVTARMNIFICRMQARGFFVGPINPGYCDVEYV